MKRGYRWLSAIFLLLMLSGCGFHLRGQHVLPCRLRCLKIESCTPYGDFEATLRRTLVRLGINVTRTGQAPIKVHIISTVLNQDVPTIGGSNQARVFVFYYQVNFEVLDDNCNVLIPPKCVTTSETLIITAGTALEATNQLEILKEEMRVEASHMILNILNSCQMLRASC